MELAKIANPVTLQPPRGLRAMIRGFCDQLVPPICLSCRTPIAHLPALCAACWSEIPFINGPICIRTGVPLPFDLGAHTISLHALANPPIYDQARAAMRYEGKAAQIIKRLKFGDAHEYAPLLAHFMNRAGAELVAQADFIIPVPLHRARLRARRFNQSAEIARELARLCDARFLPDGLQRVRNTPQQIGLSFRARQSNLRGAIQVNPKHRAMLKGKAVMVIDDVYTTGATANSCARALRKAKPAYIGIMTAARVIMPDIMPV